MEVSGGELLNQLVREVQAGDCQRALKTQAQLSALLRRLEHGQEAHPKCKCGHLKTNHYFGVVEQDLGPGWGEKHDGCNKCTKCKGYKPADPPAQGQPQNEPDYRQGEASKVCPMCARPIFADRTEAVQPQMSVREWRNREYGSPNYLLDCNGNVDEGRLDEMLEAFARSRDGEKKDWKDWMGDEPEFIDAANYGSSTYARKLLTIIKEGHTGKFGGKEEQEVAEWIVSHRGAAAPSLPSAVCTKIYRHVPCDGSTIQCSRCHQKMLMGTIPACCPACGARFERWEDKAAQNVGKMASGQK